MDTRVRCRTLFAAAVLTAAIPATAAAHQQSRGPWSQATELAPVNSTAMDGCPFPTTDGKRLFIASTRPGGFGGIDIWIAERPNTHTPWGTPTNLGPRVNSADNDFCPSPQPGGHFMFVSNRPGGCGGADIYRTRFDHQNGWAPPANLGCAVNSAADEAGPVLARHTLYFSSTRAGNSDIYASAALGSRIGPPQPIVELNSPVDDSRPFVRPDGKEIVIDSTRPGGLGQTDIWGANRRHAHEPWSQPVNLGPAVNSPTAETRPSLSSDGTTLYFGSTRGTSQDVFTSTRPY